MKDIRSKNLPELIGNYIKAGYDGLHKKHMIKLSKGDYTRTLKIPESQFYHKEKRHHEKLSDDFRKLLDFEDDSYETQERTAIFLDSCTKSELRYLTKIFGRNKLGGYADLF